MTYTVDPKEKVANKILNWVQHTQHAGLKDPCAFNQAFSKFKSYKMVINR